MASGGELFDVARGENEFGSGAGVSIGECETEAAGAAGDQDDLAGAARGGPRPQGVGGGCGDDAGEELSGAESGSGVFHDVR